MYTRDLSRQQTGEGLNRTEAEFFTENLIIRAEVLSPETRLSDFLNGSSRIVEVHPLRVRRRSGTVYDLSETVAGLTKEQILFVVPTLEPGQQEGGASHDGRRYQKNRCWAAVGQYHLIGDLYTERYTDSRLLLRALEQRQFLPISGAEVTYPDGTTVQKPVVIMNRWRLELLSVPESGR